MILAVAFRLSVFPERVPTKRIVRTLLLLAAVGLPIAAAAAL
jgi:Na+/H+-dicarboxylate symporter